MHEHSDQEQGFIASDLEVKGKFLSKVVPVSSQKEPKTGRFKTNYRFGTSFIKKQHILALNTPLTIHHDPMTAVVSNSTKKQKQVLHFEHPYKTYCRGDEFVMLYSRAAREPFTTEKEYMKNEVSLLNLDDKASPSIKQLRSHTEQQYHFNGDDLHFDSRFQNGNLHCAFRRRGTNEYHLFMSNDTNTLGYNQWFYFSVRNMQKKVKYIFHIVNYRKCLEFWRQGQRVAVFSLKNAEDSQCGWKRTGNKFAFEESSCRSIPERKQYSLSFELQFEHDNDYALVASSIPYSYSKLLKSLQELETEANYSKNVKWLLTSVSTTICNNEVPEVTITGRQTGKSDKQKRMIVIMARQHPGEVWSSYVAQGIMRSLMKESPQIRYLLQNYVIKIFPMVNVDGVIYGNFRCDVSGVDMNRRWKEPSRVFHPQIYDLKKKINSFHKKYKVDLCLDLHGHSKKYNIFCYACKHNSYTCRILPYLIENETQLFYFPSCTFGLSRDKESTARAAISRIIKSQNVLTIEASTYGWRSNMIPSHFHPLDIYRFGESMMKAVRYFVDKKSSKFKSSENNIKQNFTKFQKYDEENEEESGSESEPEEDEIDFKVKMATIMDKKFENQFKSFMKEDTSASLHLSQIVFKDDSYTTESKQSQQSLSNRSVPKATLNFQHSTKLLNTDKQRQTLKMPKRLRVSDSPLLEPKKSYSINRSDIGRDIHVELIRPTADTKGKLFVTKNIMIREKKKHSILNDTPRESHTLNPRDSIKQQVGRSNLFKDYYKQEQKQRIQNFVSKFEKFIPTSLSTKTKSTQPKNRLELLQEGLSKEDPTCQLNVMLENKRKIELQKIRKSIEDTTIISQRQGKLKALNRKDPIIDFRRFKQNQKLKLQQKKLGQFSERYLEHQS